MKPQVLVVLAVRFIGLYLVVTGLPDVLAGLGETIRQFSVNPLSYMLGYYAMSKGYFLGATAILAQFSLGCYMLLAGKRLVRFLLRGLPGVPGLCERCGYDVSGLEGGRCPECGAKIPAPSPECQ